MAVEYEDNFGEVEREITAAALRALERCGQTAEGYAADLAPVDTGRLRQDITHRVDEGEKLAYIGTEADYAIYVEMGTGIFAAGGRQTPWVYQDIHGNWHWTRGHPAQPFVKPAIANHAGEYRNIIEAALRG